MNRRVFSYAMFVIVPVLIVFGIIANVFLYNECKNDGYSTFACYSMLNKGHYVVVDAVDGRP
jgi:hypothetical protein